MVAGVGSSFGEVVVVESGPGSGSGFGLGLDSPEIQNVVGIRAVSSTLSLFSAVYSCQCEPIVPMEFAILGVIPSGGI